MRCGLADQGRPRSRARPPPTVRHHCRASAPVPATNCRKRQMTDKLKIEITAVDKATAIVRSISQSVSRTLEPIASIQSKIAGLGRDAGLGRLTGAFVAAGRAAADVTTKIGSIVAPLTAVVGIGSIAAVGALAKKWGDYGSEILRSADSIGMSTSELQAYRGAAEMADVSAEALTGNMKALGDTLQDLDNGRNNPAKFLLNRLGITLRKNAEGAIDTGKAFQDLAGRIAVIKVPQTRSLIARTFGLEESLPLLRQGPAAINRLMDSYTKTVGIMEGPALHAAHEYHMSMTRMGQTIEMVRNTIGSALLPILQPMIDRVAAWASANKNLIATRVAEFVDGFASAIKTIDWNAVIAGVNGFVDGVKAAVEFVGGWRNALIGVGVIMAAPLLLSVINLGLALADLGGLAIKGVIGSVGLLSVGFSSLMLKMAVVTATSLPALSKGFLAAGAAMETGLLGKLTKFAVYVPIAYEGGKLLGTALWKGFLEDSNVGDKIGRLVTIVRAAFGDADANAALEAEFNAKAGLPPPVAGKRTASGKVGGLASDAPPVLPALAKVQAEADIQKLIGMGWTRAQASGIAANIQRESQGDEKAVGDSGRAFGLAQWHPDRQAAFEKWAGKNLRDSNRDEQLAFINHELREGGEKSAGDALSKARDAGQAAAIVSQQYERPKDVAGEAARRAGMAVALAGPSLPQTGPAVPTPYTAPVQASAAPGAAPGGAQGAKAATGAQQGVVTVQIDFSNAPAGMKSRVQTKGPVIATTKIAYAMPEFGVA
jgi:hypothetical protein